MWLPVSFWAVFHHFSGYKEKYQQFWNCLSKADLMIPISYSYILYLSYLCVVSVSLSPPPFSHFCLPFWLFDFFGIIFAFLGFFRIFTIFQDFFEIQRPQNGGQSPKKRPRLCWPSASINRVSYIFSNTLPTFQYT